MKPLQRKALKDIKNEPPLGCVDSWKGPMGDTEGQSLSLQKPRARKGSVRFEDDVRPTSAQNTTSDAQPSAIRLPLSPKGFSTSNGSFFSDPTTEQENEGLESAGVTLGCTNKYFSTPVSSKGRAKKKLSPVLEVDTESNPPQECLDGKSCPMGAAAALGENSLETPAYRSSFAMECQEIVKQIKGSKNDCRRSPGKRKAEELDVSAIDAEPPPYDSTPFKSLLAWEVSHMISSLENSPENNPVIDGASLFGESLLDLEKTDMQLQDFNLSDLGNKSGKGQSANDGGRIEDGINGECFIKRQKLAPLPDLFHGHSVTTTANRGAASGSPLCTSQIEEHGVCNLTGEVNYDGANTSRVLQGITSHCPVLEANQPCASTTQDIDGLANTTQDLPPQQFSALNTTEVIEFSPRSVCDITQEIALLTKEDGRANTTIELKAVPPASTNVTQHTVSLLHEVTNAVSTTWVMDEEPPAVMVKVANLASPGTGEPLANTTQVMEPQAADNTQDIGSKHEGYIANITLDIESKQEGCITNTTQVIDAIPECSPNTTSSVHETSKSSNTTQVIGAVPDDFGNQTQDLAMVQDEGKDKKVCTGEDSGPIGTNVTKDTANPVGKMVGAAEGVAEDIGLVNDDSVPLDLAPKDMSTPDSMLSTTSNNVRSTIPSLELTKSHVGSPKDVPVSLPACDVVNESTKLSPKDSSGRSFCLEREEMLFKATNINGTHGEDQASISDVTHASGGQESPASMSTRGKQNRQDHSRNKDNDATSLAVIGSSPRNISGPSLYPEILNIVDISVTHAEDQMPQLDVANGSAGQPTPVGTFKPDGEDHSRNDITGCAIVGSSLKDISARSLEKEEILNKSDKLNVAPEEDQMPVSDDMTQANAGQASPVVVSTQSKLDGEDHQRHKEGNYLAGCAVVGSPTSEAPPAKKLKGRLLASESYSMIQEEENVHDVSVFSAGSLSFVTSTPVPGLNNFQFQKSCKDPQQQDPNGSLCYVMDPPQKKDPPEDCTTAQSKLKASMEGNAGHKAQSKGVPGLPTSAQGTSQMSGIPAARRSLAMFNNPTGQSLVKEPMLSKIPPKGIPGRGSIRPPLARQSLPRASLGNAKQSMEGKVGIMAPSKIGGVNFKTPRVTTAKPRSAPPPSKLPGAPSSGTAASQICTPISGGFTGTQNVTADDSSGTHTAPSTGIKSFLPNPRGSSLHQPLPSSSQRSLPKPKSNLPGLPGRRSQLPALGSQKKTVPVKAEALPVKRQLKAPSSAPQVAPSKDVVSKGPGKPNIPTTRTQQMKAEPSAESSHVPAPLSDKAEPENFCNLESCRCCQKWLRGYQTLLQENEDLKRQLGQAQSGNDC